MEIVTSEWRMKSEYISDNGNSQFSSRAKIGSQLRAILSLWATGLYLETFRVAIEVCYGCSR